MNTQDKSRDKKADFCINKSNLENIKSQYIMKKIFDNLSLKNILEFIKYNKSFQKKLNLNIDDYKNYSKIEIEIIPCLVNKKYNKFINIEPEDRAYFHIYFDNNIKEEEINKYYLDDKNKIKKIKIIIDKEIKSFNGLFFDCNEIIKRNKFF